MRPVDGEISQYFGENADYYSYWSLAGHEGVDFACPVGTPVRCIHDGTISQLEDIDGYGHYVRVQNGELFTIYAHLSDFGEPGTAVKGQVIGYSGNTGNSTGPHLHFGVCPLPRDWDNGYKGYVDPLPYLEEESRVSKLGIHFQGNPELGTEATEIIRASKIGWVKGIDVDHWPTPAAEMFPGKRVVGRFWIGGDNIEESYVLRGSQGAEEYMALLVPRYVTAQSQGCLDWLGPNEMHPNAQTIDLHVAFWYRWAEMVAGMGGRPWFGSFGVGWPDVGQIGAYEFVAKLCRDAGGGMEVHEYGAPSVLDGEGWWTLRYRRTIAELGFEVPVFIGECGTDWGVTGEAPTGWQSHKSWVYPEQYGLPAGIMNEERYWRQLSAYDDELDDYVVAATPFVTCPASDWVSFDFGGSLIQRVADKHAETPMTEAELQQAIGDAIQRHILPLNPNAALEKAGIALGLLPASDEVRDVAGYVGQAFRKAGEEGKQKIAYCAEGDWGNITWFEREN